MEAICYYAYEASSDLASERGTYSSFRGSKWDRGILPQDTIALLEEERGCEVEVPKGEKWIGQLYVRKLPSMECETVM